MKKLFSLNYNTSIALCFNNNKCVFKIFNYQVYSIYSVSSKLISKRVKFTKEIDEEKINSMEKRFNKLIEIYKANELNLINSNQNDYVIDENGVELSKEVLDTMNQINKHKVFPDHYPVLYKQIIKRIRDNNMSKETNNSGLDRNSPFLVGDLTFGRGNHSLNILENFNNSNILGIDIDSKMIDDANKNPQLQKYFKEDRLKLFKENFSSCTRVFEKCFQQRNVIKRPYNNLFNKKGLNYAILDLGFNSVQLLPGENRGISFKNDDDDLDMRFDRSNNENATAAEILNNSSRLELIEIFKIFGDEKFSDLLVKKIIQERLKKPFLKVKDLRDVIDSAFNKTSSLKDKYNTYARIFQSLRMAVNYELINITRCLSLVSLLMEKDSLLFVISFHSLEDKTVKKVLKSIEKDNLGVLEKEKVLPSEEELKENIRSKPAIMRVFRFNGSGLYINKVK
jgi:16S rRNA (cytosine1402-N4)-methyltransferase